MFHLAVFSQVSDDATRQNVKQKKKNTQFFFHYEVTGIARVYKHAATNAMELAGFKSVQSKARLCRDHS